MISKDTATFTLSTKDGNIEYGTCFDDKVEVKMTESTVHALPLQDAWFHLLPPEAA